MSHRHDIILRLPSSRSTNGRDQHIDNRKKSKEDLIKDERRFLELIRATLDSREADSVLGSSAMQMVAGHDSKMNSIYDALERNEISVLPREMRSANWTESNFFEKMKGLLHLEEAHQAIDTRRTDVTSVRFEETPFSTWRHGIASYQSVRIPGNKMATLSNGDKIYIKPERKLSSRDASHYLGTYDAEQKRVVYHPTIQRKEVMRDGKKVTMVRALKKMNLRTSFDLFAMPSRTTFKHEHNAVEGYRGQIKRLYPDERIIESSDQVKLDIDDTRFNESQQKAIGGILAGGCRPAPFILFGPPGTGKTHTLLEAVRQIYIRGSLERILICTGSNDCADEIQQKLLAMESIDSEKVIRLNAKNRRDKVDAIADDAPSQPEPTTTESTTEGTVVQLEENLKMLSIADVMHPTDEDGEEKHEDDEDVVWEEVEPGDDEDDSDHSDCPSMDEEEQIRFSAHVLRRSGQRVDEFLKGKRIVVSTCVNAGSIQEIKFDYAFLDEAGQVHEADSLIVANKLLSTGLLVLCGDPYQLGPVITCQMASDLGLGSSLLERLFERPNYKDFDERFIVQLNTSYRCDPRVLSVSNELFYDNSLICANETPEGLMRAMNVSYPLLIHSTEACDSIKPNETSSFNEEQAKICAKYFRKLIKAGYNPDQIGVISPYKKQVSYLMKYFEEVTREFRISLPQISTVERFQGNERDIIIISTVKSYFPGMKEKQFIFQKKRFNVSVSRARHMVIVVGDRRFLEKDTRCWRRYLDKAEEVGRPNGSVL